MQGGWGHLVDARIVTDGNQGWGIGVGGRSGKSTCVRDLWLGLQAMQFDAEGVGGTGTKSTSPGGTQGGEALGVEDSCKPHQGTKVTWGKQRHRLQLGWWFPGATVPYHGLFQSKEGLTLVRAADCRVTWNIFHRHRCIPPSKLARVKPVNKPPHTKQHEA
eukprot:595345-Hanusia_phi.AAC.1